MGINISGLNLDHLPPHVINNRITTDGGYTTNYIECSFDEKEKDNLCSTLRRKGAVYADLIQSQKGTIPIVYTVVTVP